MEFDHFIWLLKEWGRWHERQNAYPTHSSIENFKLGGIGGIPGSRPPRGSEIPTRVAPLVRAFLALQATEGRCGNSLAAVRMYYTTGFTDEHCAKYMELSPSRFRQLRNMGESLLYGWLLAEKSSD